MERVRRGPAFLAGNLQISLQDLPASRVLLLKLALSKTRESPYEDSQPQA
jgi:hypothetical protein